MKIGIYIFLPFICLAFSHAAESNTPWQTLDSCRLLENAGNDGDSFHVRHQGREYIFRLHYVDTPELKEMKLTERTTAQAKYFRINKRDLYALATQAEAFSKQALSVPFQVQTRWEDAKGKSSLPRHYAVITVQGKDLAELLVENGLARINGYPSPHPDGRSGNDVKASLRKIEVIAQKNKKGAWAISKALKK